MRTFILSCALLLFLSATGQAKLITADQIKEPQPLLPYCTWLVDSENKLSIETVTSGSSPERFAPLREGIPLKGTGPIWIRLVLVKSTPGGTDDHRLVMNLGELPPGTTRIYYPLAADSEEEGQGWHIEVASSYEDIPLPAPGLLPVSVYIQMDEMPGLWFSPTVSAETTVQPDMLPSELILPGLLLVACIICLLRAIIEKTQWALWASFYLLCVLAQVILPLPSSLRGFEPAHLPALLAPGMALILLPHVGRCMFRTDTSSFMQDSILYLCSFLGAAVALGPLVPGFSWLTRLFPLWPLLIAPLLPLCLGALAAKRPGALAFTGACAMPVLGAAVTLYALQAAAPPPLAAQGSMWGLAIGGLGLMLARVPKPASMVFIPDHTDEEDQATGVSLTQIEQGTGQAILSATTLTEADELPTGVDGPQLESTFQPLPDYPEDSQATASDSISSPILTPDAPVSEEWVVIPPLTKEILQDIPDAQPINETDGVAPDSDDNPEEEPLVLSNAVHIDQSGPTESVSSMPASPEETGEHATSEVTATEIPSTAAWPHLAEMPRIAVDNDSENEQFLGHSSTESDPLHALQGLTPLAAENSSQGISYAAESTLNSSDELPLSSMAPFGPSSLPDLEKASATPDNHLGLDRKKQDDKDDWSQYAGVRVISLVDDDDTSSYNSELLEDMEAEAARQKSFATEAGFLFSLHSLVRDVHDIVAPLAKTRGIVFSWYISPSLPTLLEGDAPRLRGALTLLLQNAVQATRKGAVQLAVRKNPGSKARGDLLFVIQDSGAAQRTDAGFFHAWEMASRTGGVFNVEYSPISGTQISFTVRFALPSEEAARELLDLNTDKRSSFVDGLDDEDIMPVLYNSYLPSDGGWTAVSSIETEGPYLPEEPWLAAMTPEEVLVAQEFLEPAATPSIERPYQPSPATAFQQGASNSLLQNHSEKTPSKDLNLAEAADLEQVTPAADESEVHTAQTTTTGIIRILSAEMTTSNRRLLAHYLTDIAHEHLNAARNDQVLELVRNITVSLIIFDGDTPEPDIIQTMQKLRHEESEHASGTIPVLVLTSHETQSKRLLEHGASYALVKPFNQNSLRNVVALAIPNVKLPFADTSVSRESAREVNLSASVSTVSDGANPGFEASVTNSNPTAPVDTAVIKDDSVASASLADSRHPGSYLTDTDAHLELSSFGRSTEITTQEPDNDLPSPGGPAVASPPITGHHLLTEDAEKSGLTVTPLVTGNSEPSPTGQVYPAEVEVDDAQAPLQNLPSNGVASGTGSPVAESDVKIEHGSHEPADTPTLFLDPSIFGSVSTSEGFDTAQETIDAQEEELSFLPHAQTEETEPQKLSSDNVHEASGIVDQHPGASSQTIVEVAGTDDFANHTEQPASTSEPAVQVATPSPKKTAQGKMPSWPVMAKPASSQQKSHDNTAQEADDLKDVAKPELDILKAALRDVPPSHGTPLEVSLPPRIGIQGGQLNPGNAVSDDTVEKNVQKATDTPASMPFGNASAAAPMLLGLSAEDVTPATTTIQESPEQSSAKPRLRVSSPRLSRPGGASQPSMVGPVPHQPLDPELDPISSANTLSPDDLPDSSLAKAVANAAKRLTNLGRTETTSVQSNAGSTTLESGKVTSTSLSESEQKTVADAHANDNEAPAMEKPEESMDEPSAALPTAGGGVGSLLDYFLPESNEDEKSTPVVAHINNEASLQRDRQSPPEHKEQTETLPPPASDMADVPPVSGHNGQAPHPLIDDQTRSENTSSEEPVSGASGADSYKPSQQPVRAPARPVVRVSAATVRPTRKAAASSIQPRDEQHASNLHENTAEAVVDGHDNPDPAYAGSTFHDAVSATNSQQETPSGESAAAKQAMMFPLPGIEGEYLETAILPLAPGITHALQDSLHEILHASAQQNSILVQDASGRLAAKAESYGLNRLGKITRCVERAAEAGDMEAVQTLVEDLGPVIVRYVTSLQECFNSFLNLER